MLSSNSYPQSESTLTYKFIKKNGTEPQKYLISKFKNYDCIFLGEYHRNKQDIEFVTNLIPQLYKNGIHNIAYEFYPNESQKTIDSLITANDWNEKILFHTLSKGFAINWGYTEYLNLFRKAWELNKTLKNKAPKFRIVLMGTPFFPCKNGLETFGGTDPDIFMANIIDKEIISKGEKALIYCGIHHAFTKYNQPIYDFENNKFLHFNNKRMGNVIYQKEPKKTFTIFLHSPWYSDKGWNEQCVRPANGAIDEAEAKLNNKPAGFDLKGTFAGTLESTDSYYKFGYKNFKLSDFADGYIFLLPYKTMKFVSVNPNYYDDYNLEVMKAYMKCRGKNAEQLNTLTTEQIIEMLTEDPQKHYGELVK